MLIGGKARFIASGSSVNGKKLQGWDRSVRIAAVEAVGVCAAPPFVDVALEVAIVFRLARPAGHWGKGKNAGKLSPSAPRYPTTKPDADKICRATLDSLTGIVFDDDSRIVELLVRKEYAQPGAEGARILVREAGQ